MQSPIDISSLLKAALAEDIGSGDITSNATIPQSMQTCFAMNARAEMVVCGLVFLPELFAMVDAWPMPSPVAPKSAPTSPEGRGNANGEAGEPLPSGKVEKREGRFSGEGMALTLHVADGDKVQAGTTLATISGPARALLSGERVALNLVQQLSGVATLTRRYVDAVAGTNAQILDTRKTVLGMRAAQKYAVRCGGGMNHRMGLYDAVLIKDNHIAVAGGVAQAIMAVKASVVKGITIEVECDTLMQLDEALATGCDTVLLDNMSNEQLREAVAKVDAHKRATGQAVKTEASGNVSLATVRGIAETGVDYISVGKLSHSAVAVDIGLDEA